MNIKGFSSLLGLFLFIVFVGGGLFFYTEKVSKEIPEVDIVSTATPILEENKKETPVTPDDSRVSFSVSGNNILVVKEGKTIQTLTLSEDALSVLSIENPYIKEQRFIINQDVNFDGHTDVALLTGVGYGGVNIVYDYYIFNPITSKFEKSDTLLQVSNPTIDISAKKITSSSRSGPQWYSQTFQWNGTTYLVYETVAQ